jgi:hypothetical protein
VATLRDLIRTLDDLDDDAVIYTDGTSPAARAVTVADEVAARAAKEDGLRYFLEVSLARDAVEVWSAWREGEKPTEDEKLMAVSYYATHDAYLPLE